MNAPRIYALAAYGLYNDILHRQKFFPLARIYNNCRLPLAVFLRIAISVLILNVFPIM